jgi:hypothetical protein
MSDDHDAFSELARVPVGRLLVVARLMLHDEPAAEDAFVAAGVTSEDSATPTVSMPGCICCCSTSAIARPGGFAPVPPRGASPDLRCTRVEIVMLVDLQADEHQLSSVSSVGRGRFGAQCAARHRPGP